MHPRQDPSAAHSRSHQLALAPTHARTNSRSPYRGAAVLHVLVALDCAGTAHSLVCLSRAAPARAHEALGGGGGVPWVCHLAVYGSASLPGVSGRARVGRGRGESEGGGEGAGFHLSLLKQPDSAGRRGVTVGKGGRGGGDGGSGRRRGERDGLSGAVKSSAGRAYQVYCLLELKNLPGGWSRLEYQHQW